MNDVKILVKYRQVVKKTGKTETYNTEELESLNKYLDKMYAETEYAVFLAVKINFLLGLRVGDDHVIIRLKLDKPSKYAGLS